MAGKGSRYRPVDQKTYGDNYDAIFNKEKNHASSSPDETAYDEARSAHEQAPRYDPRSRQAAD